MQRFLVSFTGRLKSGRDRIVDFCRKIPRRLCEILLDSAICLITGLLCALGFALRLVIASVRFSVGTVRARTIIRGIFKEELDVGADQLTEDGLVVAILLCLIAAVAGAIVYWQTILFGTILVALCACLIAAAVYAVALAAFLVCSMQGLLPALAIGGTAAYGLYGYLLAHGIPSMGSGALVVGCSLSILTIVCWFNSATKSGYGVHERGLVERALWPMPQLMP